jgi:hypothetical protein
LDIDYAKVTVHNDMATNANDSQENMWPLRLPPIPGQDIILDYPQGATIEDKNGVLLAIRLPNALGHVHVSFVFTSFVFILTPHRIQSSRLVKSLTRNSSSKSDFRPHFKGNCPLFKSGQAHFAY